MLCGICSGKATHYYRSVGKGNQGRCAYHAGQFGYPEYLIELEPPKAAIRQPGYVILFNEGNGQEDEVAVTWPFEEELASWWVGNVSGADDSEVEWLVSDAAYDPYAPQYLEKGRVTVEVTRVTTLALVSQH
ncbi:hypothetical protein KGG85_gp80 [Streptomyces phage Tefunt]|uniref:Uncharacterized protein n=1 Tax=Streptomyces phage Tefunt TaxID=2041209 RepID=A0A291LI16_9CAUD|nr:hypothetical protein KGG85_gp80 [Streptomyces phage Tefunt]ATI19019.1 hypothetical protein SEA_TEFUNT_80 [Streptomyces phage Tefunt]AXH70284.1 hypothetical protein SEA_HAIZUM_80 [Streptomyces phage Haizum]QAY15822.1 hypothetical protein SEA_NISHIKIGOI_81 [Streptomyces phage Nishikigoi]